ncbi:MAG: hypothetical protein LBK53_00750 [Heliobacteriaceae bacterium]|jgi:hypothetical protein|nr:hypothetical protein [Heliobacteriaceae bacterium]
MQINKISSYIPNFKGVFRLDDRTLANPLMTCDDIYSEDERGRRGCIVADLMMKFNAPNAPFRSGCLYQDEDKGRWYIIVPPRQDMYVKSFAQQHNLYITYNNSSNDNNSNSNPFLNKIYKTTANNFNYDRTSENVDEQTKEDLRKLEFKAIENLTIKPFFFNKKRFESDAITTELHDSIMKLESEDKTMMQKRNQVRVELSAVELEQIIKDCADKHSEDPFEVARKLEMYPWNEDMPWPRTQEEMEKSYAKMKEEFREEKDRRRAAEDNDKRVSETWNNIAISNMYWPDF